MKEIFRAILNNDINEVRTILQSSLWPRAEANNPDDYDRYPIHCAASIGNSAIVQILIDFGAYVDNHADSYQNSPLLMAIEAGHTDVMRTLLNNNAHVSHKELLHATRRTQKDDLNGPLYVLLDYERVNPNLTENDQSPMEIAIQRQDLTMIFALILRNADLDTPGYNDITPRALLQNIYINGENFLSQALIRKEKLETEIWNKKIKSQSMLDLLLPEINYPKPSFRQVIQSYFSQFESVFSIYLTGKTVRSFATETTIPPVLDDELMPTATILSSKRTYLPSSSSASSSSTSSPSLFEESLDDRTKGPKLNDRH